MIKKTLDECDVENKSKYYYLIGDKAYKHKNNYILKDKKVITITPNKKNTIVKNTKFKNKKLQKRIKVEHSNLNIKRYHRVMLRKETKIKTYMSWVYIASLINNILINKKNLS